MAARETRSPYEGALVRRHRAPRSGDLGRRRARPRRRARRRGRLGHGAARAGACRGDAGRRARLDRERRAGGARASGGRLGRHPRGQARAARARPDQADVRDVLDRRVRPRGGPVGRGDAVEVPRRRLGRPVGRAACRRDRDAGVREPALRPAGPRAAAPGAVRGEVVRASDRGGRGPGAPAARRRRRGGTRSDYTGSECHDWAGGRTGAGYAAQGNILVSGETVDAIAETFESSSGPLAERLIDCLAAAQAAGGDSRGQQSAALLVVETDGGYAGLSDVVIDLRVDDHKRPIEELRRLYGIHQQLFGKTPRSRLGRGRQRPARRAARAAREARLREPVRTGRGSRTSRSDVVGEDVIDPVVLEELRRQTA